MERNEFDIEKAIPQMPESFTKRTEAALRSLPQKKSVRTFGTRPLRKTAAVLIAAAVLLVSVTAFAAASVLVISRNGGKVDFFNRNDNAEIEAQQPHYERISDKVDVKLTSGDVELTVNNIAIDTEEITVFYTVSSKYAIEDGAAMPDFYASIDGGATPCAFPGNITANRVDANTFECMQKLQLFDPLPQKCTLTVFCRELLGVEKYVSADMQVDTSANDVHASDDELHFYVDGHDVTARIYIDADGGVLELKETAPYDWNEQAVPYQEAFRPFVDFALFNEAGEPLHAHIGRIVSSHNAGAEVVNRVRFDADMDTESITVVPILSYENEPAYADIMFDETGVAHELYEGLEVTLISVDFDEDERTITVSYKEDGVTRVSSKSSLHYFLGENGSRLECGDVASDEEPYRDDATGIYTQKLYFLTRIFDPAMVKGIRFFYTVPVIDMTNAVVVPVSGK